LPAIRRGDYEAVTMAFGFTLLAVRFSSELSGSRPGTAVPFPDRTGDSKAAGGAVAGTASVPRQRRSAVLRPAG